MWAFDVEWVPDPVAGKVLYDLPADMPDAEVIGEMWKRGGATEEEPRPFLKTVLCKIVSLSMISRTVGEDDGVKVSLHSIPHIGGPPEEREESRIITTFLEEVGKHKPQVVGYNSVRADLKILVQRAITNGLSIPQFARRPAKPWEGPDYFSPASEWNVDMMQIVGGNRSTPSLNELARLSGIPGKMGVDGNEVAPLWLEGKLDDIVRYNEFDAITTYLLWLRFAYFGGFFDKEKYATEQRLVGDLLERRQLNGGNEHLKEYLKEWKRLSELVGA